MVARNFHLDSFLRSVWSTSPFADYCRVRGIPGELGSRSGISVGVQGWKDAVMQMTGEQQARIESELAKVHELAGCDFVTHLRAATADAELPPDDIPGNSALSLWFFLHHPTVFHEVFLHEQVREVNAWRIARARAGCEFADLAIRSTALGESMREFFKVGDGTGRFCAVDAYRLKDTYFFAADVADRVRLLEVFTDHGERSVQRLRPATRLYFAYYPKSGTVLLQSRLRAEHRVLDLVRRFGQTVLDVDPGPHCLRHAFDLDRLKGEFHPLPDEPDLEMVRVKALHLRYPARLGNRQVKLETLVNDEPLAVRELLRTHFTGNTTLDQVRVCHAELQFRFRVEGGSRNHLVRLWPDRCNLNQTVLGERLRQCLARWGLYHDR